ncbi:GNAT family N-acetyltransferase [Pararhizobium sp. LjRoot238]|uniref:GNAT family N-acetyltransferase n=1 Tax=Pararhizobium sp. LjRoot238 TaxID=3342293 RepID=UPI003ED08DF8
MSNAVAEVSMYSARPILNTDTGNLVELWRQTWIATYTESLGADALEAMLSNLDAHGASALLPDNGEQGYCAVVDDEIVGSAIFADRGGTAYLWGMYVSPLHQRGGVGTLLLEAVSSASNSDRLEIRVLSAIEPALSFYTKQGFKITGQEETEIMPAIHANSLIMSLKIDRSRISLGFLRSATGIIGR